MDHDRFKTVSINRTPSVPGARANHVRDRVLATAADLTGAMARLLQSSRTRTPGRDSPGWAASADQGQSNTEQDRARTAQPRVLAHHRRPTARARARAHAQARI